MTGQLTLNKAVHDKDKNSMSPFLGCQCFYCFRDDSLSTYQGNNNFVCSKLIFFFETLKEYIPDLLNVLF